VGVSDPGSVLGVVQAQFFELGAGGVEFCPFLGRAGNKGFEPSDFFFERVHLLLELGPGVLCTPELGGETRSVG